MILWYMNSIIKKLDGLLLSDGSITKQGSYMQESTHIDWLDDIGIDFLISGFKYNINTNRMTKWSTNQLYRIWSNISPFFKEQRDRWYKKWYPDPNNDSVFYYRKIVPYDIELTPECVANWYMGDGCINRRYLNSYRIIFYTNSFMKEEVERLASLLNKETTNEFYINKSKVKKSGEQSYIIQITKTQKVKEFIEYIKPYIIPSFDYKIPLIN